MSQLPGSGPCLSLEHLRVSDDAHPDSQMETPYSSLDSSGHSVQVSNINHSRVGLQTLPTEIILHLLQYTPRYSFIALSQICRRFHQQFAHRIEDVFDRYHHPSETKRRLKTQKKYKDFLVKHHVFQDAVSAGTDNKPWAIVQPQQSMCVTCNKTREIQAFSITALRQPPVTRQCLMHEGRLWLCPSNVWDYNQAMRFSNNHGQQAISQSPEQALMSGPCECGRHSILLQANAVIQVMPLFAPRTRVGKPWCDGYMFKRKIGKMRMHVRICPHTSISDPKVLDCFSFLCGGEKPWCKWSSDCQSVRRRDPERDMSCETCGTSFQFRMQKSMSGQEMLFLLTRKTLRNRNLPLGSDENIEMWQNHISLPSEFKGLKDDWERRSKVLSKFNKGDWKIMVTANDPFRGEFRG